MIPRRRRTHRLAPGAWQRRVWARIALGKLLRSPWRRGADSDSVVPRSATMTHEPRRWPAVRRERSNRALWSWLRRLARLGAAAALCVVILEQRSDTSLVDRSAICAAATRAKRQDAVAICRLEYERTRAPATGAHLAQALYDTDDDEAARRVALGLLDTPVRSDALYVLGSVARDDGKDEDALTALQEARGLHRVAHRHRELANDDAVVAMVRIDRDEFEAALRLIDECLTESQLAGDRGVENRCRLSAVKALIHVGHGPAAQRELELSEPLATTDQQRSDHEYQRANFAQEFGDHATAVARFKNAEQYRKHSRDTRWTLNTELNLAYSLAETGDLDEAQQRLDNARLLDADHAREPERTWVAAQIAFRRHDLARAITLVHTYFAQRGPDDSADPEDRDDRLDVAVLGAQIERARSAPKQAAAWAQQAIDQAEAIRRGQALELRPWILAKRRAPYELKFIALADSQQTEAAVMAFDEWQGRVVQDALATTRPPAALGYRGVAEHVTKLGAWLRVASQAALARRPDPHAVLRTMQDIELVALIVADGDVWRLVADHGPPRLSKIQPLTDLEEDIAKFRGHPTEGGLASKLGAALLPAGAFRTTREVLHVLVDGKLGGLPVAALRLGGDPLIAMRPIVRVLRLPEARCARVARAGHATVLATGDEIPLAVTEARQVAALLHTTAQTGVAATRAALFAAADDAVLHVAAHGAMGIDGAALVLADGEVPALEVPVRRLAPALVVLTACDAAAADDPELAGSLAAGFLGAGTQHVVATLRSISDAGGLAIGPGFYRAGGIADPPRALAAVQAALAKTDNTDWPNIVVFGPEVCSEPSLDPR